MNDESSVDIHGPIEMHPDLDPNKGVELAAVKRAAPLKVAKTVPPSVVYIVNTTTEESAPGLAALLPAILVALSKHVANDVAPRWGGAVPAFQLANAADVPEGASTVFLQDTLDAPGALGYHNEVNGVPMGYIGVGVILANGGTIFDGANSISVTLSHEIDEMFGDWCANLWADGTDGSDYARELSDAVEDGFYNIDGIAMTNFVYPAFFDPEASADEKLDHLGVLKAPFTMTSGGYQIKRSEPGTVSQVFGASHVRIIAHDKGRVVHAVFGANYPTWKIPGKIAKLRARRAPKAKAA